MIKTKKIVILFMVCGVFLLPQNAEAEVFSSYVASVQSSVSGINESLNSIKSSVHFPEIKRTTNSSPTLFINIKESLKKNLTKTIYELKSVSSYSAAATEVAVNEIENAVSVSSEEVSNAKNNLIDLFKKSKEFFQKNTTLGFPAEPTNTNKKTKVPTSNAPKNKPSVKEPTQISKPSIIKNGGSVSPSIVFVSGAPSISKADNFNIDTLTSAQSQISRLRQNIQLQNERILGIVSDNIKYSIDNAPSNLGIFSSNLTIGGSGTSTAANGIEISSGCFSINGACLNPSAGGSGITSFGVVYFDEVLIFEIELK
jgi:hypothetical protein